MIMTMANGAFFSNQFCRFEIAVLADVVVWQKMQKSQRERAPLYHVVH
jgi:hypothetical protein